MNSRSQSMRAFPTEIKALQWAFDKFKGMKQYSTTFEERKLKLIEVFYIIYLKEFLK